jgi:phosphatidylglycerol lysyltransferase
MLVVLVTGLLINRLLSGRGQHAPVMPDTQQLQQAAVVIAHSQDAQHCVALVGDKALMWSDDQRAFIAFSVTPRFWVAIGDPCGAPDACENVVWKFREEADRYGAGIAFYHVSPNALPLYIDMGLSLIKLGEEALVDLTDFSLEGKKRHFLRQRCAQFEREDYEFVIVEREQVLEILSQLRWISDDWLKNKGAREKAFSLGFFSADYLARTRIAAVRKNDQIIAFANLWEVDSKQELSLDLMRYHRNARAGAMEFLFARMMLWGKEQGYHWFNLGMAPLAGLENHRLAPRWHKLGNVVFRFGNDFYNFEGLHFYKNKFEPVWRPRYFAAPAGLATADALMQVTRLINRGYHAARDNGE